jgi:integrase
MALTDLKVKKLVPRDKRYEVLDGKGLSIRVMPTGSKSWVFRYMIDGRARRMTLGTYPALSLSEVREQHAKAMQDIERGIDPSIKKMESKAERKTAPTFTDLIKELWHMELKNQKSGVERKRLLEKDIVPAWGKRKVADIKRRDIVLLLDHVRERAPITANRLHGSLSRLFNFAAERGIIEDSPCTRIKKPPEKGRSRVLTDSEIKLLWKALDINNAGIDIYRISKLALTMVLLTGQRPGEVCGMAWDEIDNEGFWNIPAERMKGGEPNRVPLTDMALEVIDQARLYSGDKSFVFASSHKSDGPVTTQALAKAVLRHRDEMGFEERFTPHDLRRTLRTRLAELGIDDVVAERVLGHKLQGIMAIYNRHGYDKEKRQALERWEKKLRQIIGIEEPETSKIIKIGGRHA